MYVWFSVDVQRPAGSAGEPCAGQPGRKHPQAGPRQHRQVRRQPRQ